MSLLSVMVAIGVMGIAALMFSKFFKAQTSAISSLEKKYEFEDIRRLIAQNIDCAHTFSDAGIDPLSPGTSCESTSGAQVGPFLRLRRKTVDPSIPAYLTPPVDADGSARLGSYLIRTTCSKAEQSMIIKVARVNEDGSFAKDPLTNRELNWSSVKSLLHGVAANGQNATPICYSPYELGIGLGGTDSVTGSYCGVTPAIVGGEMGGASAANARCQTACGTASARVCSQSELERTIRQGRISLVPRIPNAWSVYWYSGTNGSGYLANCNGWSSRNNYGSVFLTFTYDPPYETWGSFQYTWAVSCIWSYPALCCDG